VVELQKGDVESEFSHLMEKSEQVPTALLFETVVDENGESMHIFS
jgi:redox-regulated HSP33 family molecular chaperone